MLLYNRDAVTTATILDDELVGQQYVNGCI